MEVFVGNERFLFFFNVVLYNIVYCLCVDLENCFGGGGWGGNFNGNFSFLRGEGFEIFFLVII